MVEWQDACGADSLPPSPPRAAAVEAAPSLDPPKQRRAPDQRVPSAPAIEPALPAPEIQLAPEERKRRLSVLGEKVSTCTLCVLSEKRTQTVFARGNPL